jgi:phosphoenolpyruvate synthase/pyruvate phosphate dikinase
MRMLYWFEETCRGDAASAGLAADFGELAHNGLPVPKGFVLTADAHREFLKRLGADASQDVKAIVSASGLPFDYKFELVRAYNFLCEKSVHLVREPALVKIRCGERFAYANAAPDVASAVLGFWASAEDVPVIIHDMPAAELCGTVKTASPFMENAVVVRSCYGVEPQESADTYTLRKDTFEITDSGIAKQESMRIIGYDKTVQAAAVPFNKQESQKLGERQVVALARLACAAEDAVKKSEFGWILTDRGLVFTDVR